jgi:hypothetical protein
MGLIRPELFLLLKIVYPLGPNIAYMLVGLCTDLGLLVGCLHTVGSAKGT